MSCLPLTFVTSDIYFKMILDASVLPEPDSPDITMQLSFPCRFIILKADSAMANICGGLSNISLPFQSNQVFHINELMCKMKMYSYLYIA